MLLLDSNLQAGILKIAVHNDGTVWLAVITLSTEIVNKPSTEIV